MNTDEIFPKRYQAPNPPQITLNDAQMDSGAEYGLRRRQESRSMGLVEKFCAPGDAEQRDISAAQAEIAVAIFTGKPWNGKVGTFKKADVGDNIQVRYTRWLDGCLCGYPDDNPNHIYVLVTGTPPTFNIVGWLLGKDMQKEEFKREPNGHYWVTQDKINLFKNDNPDQSSNAGQTDIQNPS